MREWARFESLPTRERGLKLVIRAARVVLTVSLPTRERGLKHGVLGRHGAGRASLPTRERGLKQAVRKFIKLADGRSPRGSVD